MSAGPLSTASKIKANKLLFDDEYIFSESFDVSSVTYSYPTNGAPFQFSFSAQPNSQDPSGGVTFKDKAFEESDLSFAMESAWVNEETCKQNASEKLQELIDSCENVILRELTKEEKKQMEEFKQEQQSKRPLSNLA